MDTNKLLLKSLSIINYRGFFSEGKISFAIPNGNPGSGLTVIAGPNNTGKTSIIEALTLNIDSKIPASERHGETPPIITIETSDGISKFSTIDNGSNIHIIDDTKPLKIELFEIISSRRIWDSLSHNLYDITQVGIIENKISRQINNNSQFSSVLKGINQDKEKKIKYTELIRIFIPHFNSWTVDTDDAQQDYIKYITKNGMSHKTNLLGDGVISIFRICAHLLLEDINKILIIDEPEQSLHPTAQKLLANVLSKKARDRQIIVCTHSPYFINWDNLHNNATFVRLNKYDDKECTIHTLNKDVIENLYKLNTYNNPHLLDIASKEIMFATNLLFVEGQEDVGLIYRWAKENGIEFNFEIYAYGTKGWEHISIFLEISNLLGIQKIGALYDKGKATDIKNKNGKSISLNNDFEENVKRFNNYCILQLPTMDIRDKSSETLGIFDKDGKLKENTPEEKENAEQFKEIMQTYITYFETK